LALGRFFLGAVYFHFLRRAAEPSVPGETVALFSAELHKQKQEAEADDELMMRASIRFRRSASEPW